MSFHKTITIISITNNTTKNLRPTRKKKAPKDQSNGATNASIPYSVVCGRNEMGVLILHILLWVTGVSLLGLGYRHWSNKPDVDPRPLVLSGAFLGIFAVFSPLIGTAISGPGQLFSLQRNVEFWLIWVGVCGLAVFFLWRINRIFTDSQRVRQLRAEAWRQGISEDTETGLGIEQTRMRLEKKLREQSGNPRVVLRWSDQIQLPFTIGSVTPEVFAPMWAAYEANGIHMGPLLAHEREHIRLGHAIWSTAIRWLSALLPHVGGITQAIRLGLEVEADRNVIQKELESGNDPGRYIETLKRVVGPAGGSGPEAGLGHDRSNIVLRVDQILRPPRRHWRFPAMGAVLLLVLIGCHAALGRVDFGELYDLATLRIQPNYNLNSPFQGVELHSIPGKGGVFMDGLEINTRNIPGGKRVEMILIRSLRAGETQWSGFHGTMEVRVLHRPPAPCPTPIIYAETAERSGGPRVSQAEKVTGGADKIVDIDWVPIEATGRYQVSVGRTFSGPPHTAAAPGEIAFLYVFVPDGWVVQLLETHLESYTGSPRPLPEVVKSRQAFFKAVPIESLAHYEAMDWSSRRLYDFSP